MIPARALACERCEVVWIAADDEEAMREIDCPHCAKSMKTTKAKAPKINADGSVTPDDYLRIAINQRAFDLAVDHGLRGVIGPYGKRRAAGYAIRERRAYREHLKNTGYHLNGSNDP